MSPTCTIHEGDCRERLREIASDSLHACVTDPPYELTSARPGGRSPATEGRVMKGFMGMLWDGTGIAYDVEMWREVLRVLKPGAYLLAFGGTRTHHRMVCAIEDAGFEIRDEIQWVYATGFPKSLDVSKAIDKELGREGALGGPKSAAHAGWIERGKMRGGEGHEGLQRPWMDDPEAVDRNARVYIPATPEAAQWEGFGTALKPAHEPICLARKPLVGTVAKNVLTHGTGGLNIDGCRIPAERSTGWGGGGSALFEGGLSRSGGEAREAAGRFPSNFIHDGSPEVLALFPESAGQLRDTGPQFKRKANVYGEFAGVSEHKMRGDAGSAARFFFCAKTSARDRNEGCGSLPDQEWSGEGACIPERADRPFLPSKNNHPTVKPNALMRYLCRLVTPPGGTVLDPFCGSGSTMKAALEEGFSCVGIELDPHHVAIARARTLVTPGLPFGMPEEALA